MTRSGFIGLAGRPNVGKSTLVNAIVGSHVAIVSSGPRRPAAPIRGVATDAAAGWQLVLVDLPGVQRPRDVLTERMQRRVERELASSDVALLVINGEEGVGPGDRFIARALLAGKPRVPVVCAVNKADRLSPQRAGPGPRRGGGARRRRRGLPPERAHRATVWTRWWSGSQS